MYSRPQNYRYTGDVRLPQNYGGNAFWQQNEQKSPPSHEEDLTPSATDESELEEAISPRETSATDSLLPKPSFKLRLGSLLGNNKKGIGTEELLIMALILLIADGDGNDDLILFLIFLLFVG